MTNEQFIHIINLFSGEDIDTNQEVSVSVKGKEGYHGIKLSELIDAADNIDKNLGVVSYSRASFSGQGTNTYFVPIQSIVAFSVYH